MPAAREDAPWPASPFSRTTTRPAPCSFAKTDAHPPIVPAPTTTRSAVSRFGIGSLRSKRPKSSHAYSGSDAARHGRSVERDPRPAASRRPQDARRGGPRGAVAVGTGEGGVRDPVASRGADRGCDRRGRRPIERLHPPDPRVRLRARAGAPRVPSRPPERRGTSGRRSRSGPAETGSPPRCPRVRGRRDRRPRGLPGRGGARREPVRRADPAAGPLVDDPGARHERHGSGRGRGGDRPRLPDHEAAAAVLAGGGSRSVRARCSAARITSTRAGAGSSGTSPWG